MLSTEQHNFAQELLLLCHTHSIKMWATEYMDVKKLLQKKHTVGQMNEKEDFRDFC